MFQKIKDHFLKKYLTENVPARKTQLIPVKQAKSIGLICEITNEDSYKSIFHIFTRLQNEGHTVKLIGYVNEKEVPFYCLPQLTADYFCNKHLNWFGLPNMLQIKDFLKVDFDVVLDFNYRYNAPVKALLAQTNAKFVIGREVDCASYYDLFINCGKCDNLKFLELVNLYTQKLSGNDR